MLRSTDEIEMRIWREKQQQAQEASAGLNSSADPYGPFSAVNNQLTPVMRGGAFDNNDSPAARPFLGAQPSTPWTGQDDAQSYMEEGGSRFGDSTSVYAPSTMLFDGNEKAVYPSEKTALNGGRGPGYSGETIEVIRQTGPKRRIWAGMTWAATFWIPNFALSSVGRMKRPDVRMAWREKLLIKCVLCGASSMS